MKKQKIENFSETYYLIGKDSAGIKYWLRVPTWDSLRNYWGGFRIYTFTNNRNPEKSEDYESCGTVKGVLTPREENRWLVGHYETRTKSDMVPYAGIDGVPWYYHYQRLETRTPYENPYLDEKTFNQKEGWELGELIAQIQFLREAAEMFGRGKAHVADTIVPLWKDEAKVKEINESLIPIITARIIEILSPIK